MATDYVVEYANESIEKGADKAKVDAVISDYKESGIHAGEALSRLIDISEEAEEAKIAEALNVPIPENTRLRVFKNEDEKDEVLEYWSNSRGEFDDDLSPELQRAYDDLWQTYWNVWEWADGTGNVHYQRVYGYLCTYKGVPGVTIVAEFNTERTEEAVQKAVDMTKNTALKEAEVYIGLGTSTWCDWEGEEATFSEVGIFVPWNTPAGKFTEMWCAHAHIAGYSLSENQDLKKGNVAC